MREFLEHIANSETVFIDDVSEFGFEYTFARAFYIKAIVKERIQEKDKKDFDDDAR